MMNFSFMESLTNILSELVNKT